MNPIKAMLVTDVPFWERVTGAHNRISGLIEGINEQAFPLQVLVTQMEPGRNVDVLLSQQDYPVQFVDLSKPPATGFWSKAKWYGSALFNQLGWRAENLLGKEKKNLDNWYKHSTTSRIREMILAADPDVLIMEYVTQVSVVRSLPARFREKTVIALDSHDILWKRNEQFRENAREHWLDISRSQEERALKEFDLVIAIQSQEAQYMATVVGEEKVITTSMEFEPVQAPGGTSVGAGVPAIKVGFLASENSANVDAVSRMLEIWPKLVRENPVLELVIGGSVCRSNEVTEACGNVSAVSLIGPVGSLSDFYSTVDVIWNPVRFGTGLKIKNLEALAFGKCLVTSRHAAEGMGAEQCRSQPFFIADTQVDLETVFRGLDGDSIEAMSRLGSEFLIKQFGKGTQYPALRQKIASLLSEKSS